MGTTEVATGMEGEEKEGRKRRRAGRAESGGQRCGEAGSGAARGAGKRFVVKSECKRSRGWVGSKRKDGCWKRWRERYGNESFMHLHGTTGKGDGK